MSRAIDADELSKKLKEELHNRLMQGFGKGLLIANSCVINAPTIEPRKKGKWINIREGNRADCDQCGQSGRAWMNFCFDCGADMREPEDIPMEYFESGGR